MVLAAAVATARVDAGSSRRKATLVVIVDASVVGWMVEERFSRRVVVVVEEYEVAVLQDILEARAVFHIILAVCC